MFDVELFDWNEMTCAYDVGRRELNGDPRSVPWGGGNRPMGGVLHECRLFSSAAARRMIVDVEESCSRLGLEIAAIVKNVEGPDYALSRERVMKVDSIDPAIKSCRYIVPFLTPGNRFAAHQRRLTRMASRIRPRLSTRPRWSRDRRGSALGSYVNIGVVIGGAAQIGAFVFINRGCQHWTSRRYRLILRQ